MNKPDVWFANSLSGYEFVQGTEDASAFDIRTPVALRIVRGQKPVTIKLGIFSELNDGVLALIAPRSGLGSKGMFLANTVGFIDTDYRGEWQATIGLHAWSDVEAMEFQAADRILQVAFVHVTHKLQKCDRNSLTLTKRGEGGLGHTGVK